MFLECSRDSYFNTAFTNVNLYRDDHLPPMTLQLAYRTLNRDERVDVSFLVTLACWRKVVCIVASEWGHDLWCRGVPERNRVQVFTTIMALEDNCQQVCINV